MREKLGKNFKALITSQKEDGTFENIVKEKLVDHLPNGELLVRVEYSSLNYKDALSAIGNKGVTREYPHTPGIDAAGIIEESSSPNFSVGMPVIVTGYDLGMNTAGGFGEYIRVPEGWAIKRPNNLTAKESMIIGTAGLTAGLCVKALDEKSGISGMNAVVSGATGGVGCMAVKLLAHLGAEVTALTGKSDASSFLKNIGAHKIISRTEFLESVRGPIGKGMWDIAVDVAGGDLLSAILASMRYGGTVTCCGLVDSPSFNGSVFPFILRGNSLIGIDSAEQPLQKKAEIWDHFSKVWKMNGLDSMCHTVNLDGILPEINKILSGRQIGRVVLEL